MAPGRILTHPAASAAPFFPMIRAACWPAALAFVAALTLANSRSSQAQPRPETAAQPAISEDQLKQMLAGKFLYLRGGYLDNSLAFNDRGALIGHSPSGSFTLCLVEISKVRLTKRRVELEGVRYGLHFLGALPHQDSTAVDRVRITPKKKVLKISIERQPVITSKRAKEKPARHPDAAIQPLAAPPEGQSDAAISPAQASQTLLAALHNVFADGLDTRMIAAMPPFWKLYYQAAEARTDFRPSDPAVQSQSIVDHKARLLSSFEPPSNEYAQAAGVAGVALYHAVIGADGKPDEIAVARPIGFGLDENAVEAIRKAQFQPAMKNGEPVPVVLDLVVEFRIYSKRTAAPGVTPSRPLQTSAPALPGPYSVPHR